MNLLIKQKQIQVCFEDKITVTKGESLGDIYEGFGINISIHTTVYRDNQEGPTA